LSATCYLKLVLKTFTSKLISALAQLICGDIILSVEKKDFAI